MARDYVGDSICECGKDIPVYKTGGGMLTTSCGWCRKQEHCGAGSQSFRRLSARIKTGINPEEETKTESKPKPAKAPAAAPAPAPAEKVPADAAKTIFDIFKG